MKGRPETRKRLTWLIWRARARAIVPIALILVPIVAIFAVVALDRAEPGATLPGTLVGLHQPQSETPQPTQFVVQLDSGPAVEVGGTATLLFEKGRRVIVREQVSRFLGRRKYTFVRYADDE